MKTLSSLLLATCLAAVAPTLSSPAWAQGTGPRGTGATGAVRKGQRVDVEAVQGVLAVRGLDGWLLCESKGKNSIAVELVRPDGATSRPWCYFIPASGQPVVLVHKSEASAFDRVPGTKVEYSGYRDMKSSLRSVLKGAMTVAMEYAPETRIPSLTRVDSSIAEQVKRAGVTITSSADLVQLTKSVWGPDGRLAHYVAVHHLSKLRQEALAFIAERIKSDRPVSEFDVQQFIANGMRARGLVGEASVAAGDNTARPNYRSSSISSSAIKKDQLLYLRLNGVLADADRGIHASVDWLAYVGSSVPERLSKNFEIVKGARNETVEFIRSKVEKRRLVKGFQADQVARSAIGKAGLADKFVHRTGHSLDTSLTGDGANLDDYETHDTRNLVIGSGFTIGPGIYLQRDFGMRSTVNVHLVRDGLEVTTPQQERISAILGE